MDSHHAAPEPVLLFIADISGYTRYMTANARTLAHSQTIITELIEAVVRQIELPLEVAKLEGDAIFLFCRRQNSPQWQQTRRIIGDKLLIFFRMFSEKIGELSRSTTCNCNACAHIEKLRLKIVVHSGETLFHQVLNFVELAGVDVIIVHRLLKNSVTSDQYLLLTEAARHEIEFSEKVNFAAGMETYEDIGRINTLIFLPEGKEAVARASAASSFASRFGRSWKLFCKLWFAPFASHSNLFRNVASDAGTAGRAGFALLTALLTPLFLPVGTLFVLFHALKPPAKIQSAGDSHEHKADGSCCRRH